MSLPLSYVGQGTEGLPVLLIHGFPMDKAMWHGVLGELAPVARAVAVDLPGFGGSPPVGDGRTAVAMESFGDDVLALADALGFQRFVLAGLSMGGYIALAIARRAAHRLAGLVLCDTRPDPDTAESRADRVRIADLVLASGTENMARTMPGRLLSPWTQANRPDVVAETEAMMRRASPVGVAAALRGMAERRDARPDLAAIAVPTLVVVGADDALSPPALARQYASQIPGATVAVIPNAGHIAPLEQPAEVGRAMRELLGRLRG